MAAPRAIWTLTLTLGLLLGTSAQTQDSALNTAWDQADQALTDNDSDLAAQAGAVLDALTASEDANVAARAHFKLGELAERFESPQAALAHYERVAQRDPSNRYASRALRRVRSLTGDRRNETAIYRALERVKSGYLEMGSDAAVAEVEALLEQSQEATTRSDCLLWLGYEYLYAQKRLDLARSRFLEVTTTPGVAPARAVEAFFGALEASPRLVELSVVQWHLEAYLAAHPESVNTTSLARLLDEVVDRRLRRIALFVSLAAFILLAFLWTVRRGWRAFTPTVLRHWRPWRGLLFVCYVFLVGGAVAEMWEPGYLLPFAACIPFVGAVFLAMGAIRWANGPDAWTGVRAIGAALVGTTATLGAVFVPLYALGETAILGM